jgi:hypothetical protein
MNWFSIQLSKSNSEEGGLNLLASILEKSGKWPMNVRRELPFIFTLAGSEGQLVVSVTDEQPTLRRKAGHLK